jgi:biopolymer transport protein ExbB/TolQ
MNVTIDPTWIAILFQMGAFVWALARMNTVQSDHARRLDKFDHAVKDHHESRATVHDRLARIETALERLLEFENRLWEEKQPTRRRAAKR